MFPWLLLVFLKLNSQSSLFYILLFAISSYYWYWYWYWHSMQPLCMSTVYSLTPFLFQEHVHVRMYVCVCECVVSVVCQLNSNLDISSLSLSL